MDLVDTHTHVVSKDEARYPLAPHGLPGEWYRKDPASAEDLAREMTDAGVAQAVLVQGVGAYGYDNRYAADAAAADPARFVSAAGIDGGADDALEQVDHWVGAQGMHGVRLFALSRDGGPSWLANERTPALVERAASLGAHVIVTVLPHQLDELDGLLLRCPTISIALDHCGFALGPPGDATSRARLFALASRENLLLKVTTHVFDDATRAEGSARPVIAELVRTFGAGRLMWGSDYCQIHDRPYATLVALARDAFGGLDPVDRAACLSGTARAVYPALAHT